MTEIVLAVLVFGVICFLCLMMRDKDKTIRELTDKLMSRNYTEYVSMTRARDDPHTNVESRKPLSWYDDPNVPDVDDEDLQDMKKGVIPGFRR
ncbi:hypothetical protein [Paenibacillus motobuensis]|uniref:Uncharacterized protein n=1 Tax=Paenibacillus motobuensis TaxID=295324 RepID=A0ABP3HWW8_9BACL